MSKHMHILWALQAKTTYAIDLSKATFLLANQKQKTSNSLSVPIYIFFPTRCKFLLGKLQSLFNLATTDKLNETLLLQVEK
jgi:hypothetical protein